MPLTLKKYSYTGHSMPMTTLFLYMGHFMTMAMEILMFNANDTKVCLNETFRANVIKEILIYRAIDANDDDIVFIMGYFMPMTMEIAKICLYGASRDNGDDICFCMRHFMPMRTEIFMFICTAEVCLNETFHANDVIIVCKRSFDVNVKEIKKKKD